MLRHRTQDLFFFTQPRIAGDFREWEKKDEVKIFFYYFFWTFWNTQLDLPSCHPGLCGILSAWVGYCSSSSMVQTPGSSLPCVPIKFFFNIFSVLSFFTDLFLRVREMGMAL